MIKGGRGGKRSHKVKLKKEEMKGCYEVKEVMKLRSEVEEGMSNFLTACCYYSVSSCYFLLSMHNFSLSVSATSLGQSLHSFNPLRPKGTIDLTPLPNLLNVLVLCYD